MCVTDIVKGEIPYVGDRWLPHEERNPVDVEKEIRKYNKSFSRFTFFPWGVWCTAFARRNLFTGISEFSRTGDYIYSDTDSIKVTCANDHMDYITEYNSLISNQLEKALEYHNIDPEEVRPKTVEGIEKPLGVWDFDGHYDMFKTLGAKRYMVRYSTDARNPKKKRGKIEMTVAGLSKHTAITYMTDKWNDEVFNAFNDSLYIPGEYTGKSIHTYIDSERSGVVTDYKGVRETYHEKSAIHLGKAEYSLKLSDKYARYLLQIKEREV